MNILLKVACYAALMSVWGVFAFFGKTPVNGFIEAIAAALTVLGAVHVVADAKKAASPAPAPVPDVAPSAIVLPTTTSK